MAAVAEARAGLEYACARELMCEELIPELAPLAQSHYAEVAYYQDIPLAPDYARYIASEWAGNLRLYTVRVEGELVGYAIYLVGVNVHYRSSFQANQDVLFLKKEFRKGMLGSRLLDFSERCLKAEGVQVVYQHIKAASKGLGRFLRLRRYELIDEIYGKRLDR